MKKIAILFAAAVFAMPLMAQDNRTLDVKADTVRGLKHYKGSDNWFIGVGVGVNHSLSENARFASFWDMTKPSVALSVGKYFSPAIGARVQLAYMKHASRANSESIEAYPSVYGDGNYTFNMFAGYLDGLFNLNNIFGQYKESTRFNVVGIIGIGANHSFGFDEDKVEGWATGKVGSPYDVNTDARTYWALRGGVQLNYMLSNALDLNLEFTYNATDDGYNGNRYDRKWDAYGNLMLGLTYHFKDQYGDRRFRYTELNDQAMLDDLNRRINEERANKPVPPSAPAVKQEVVKNEVLDMTVSFIIDKYNVTDIQKKNVAAAAKYLEEHPDVNLIVCGYADVKTAYPAYNLRLSKRRAQSVYNMLVKDFGVSPDRLRMDYKGDTIQPYQMKNEWNRVVVFITEPRNK